LTLLTLLQASKPSARGRVGSWSTESHECELLEALSDVVAVLEEYYTAGIITVQTPLSSDRYHMHVLLLSLDGSPHVPSSQSLKATQSAYSLAKTIISDKVSLAWKTPSQANAFG